MAWASIATWAVALSTFALVACAQSNGEEPVPSFYRGLNLNGPPVTIDGNAWDGQSVTNYRCSDSAFENQAIALTPETDAERAKMIRSSRYGGNRVELQDIPAGLYTVMLYVWEDNNSETYSVSVNNKTVLRNHVSGAPGHWDRLGPWLTQVGEDGQLIITSQGGAANFSGIEIWRGDYDGSGFIPTPEGNEFFEKRIRPILVARCYECHSQQSDELQGDYLVDSRHTLRKGGARGLGLVPGDRTKGHFLEAIRYDNEELQMPPDGKLSDEEIADLEAWVAMGAPDPRSKATKHQGKTIDIAAAREFWSLRPVTKPTLPEVANPPWPRQELDHWVWRGMQEHGLTPAPEADRRTWLRRVTYDLHGLPPSPEEIDAFENDQTGDAFARVVDRLMSSPRYGERWGRHWMDVVRYADTAGDNSDYPIPQAHRYRDWIIEAFNRDMPYNEFVRDQLAGDLLGGLDDRQRMERIIATGYIASARRFGSRVDDYPQHLTIEDTLDNVGKAFLGLSLSCARCHDHKFDPITQRDYYALYGIFHSTRYPWPGIELDKKQRDFVPLIPSGEEARWQTVIDQYYAEQKRLDREVKQWEEKKKGAEGADKDEIEKRLTEAKTAARAHRDNKPIRDAYAVADAKQIEDVALHVQGNPERLGDVVERRFLTVLGGQPLSTGSTTSGRRELAEWIVAPDNPLFARVMVNRIWQHHFGRGIVPTPNDFGKQGKPPSHHELLDYLASTFVAYEWSIKAMHRMIVLSATYRQSSERSSEAIELDPTNVWLSSFPRRRLDAESLRDTLLMLGGNLDLSPAGPHPFPPQSAWDFTQHQPFKAIYASERRSVYLMTQRIQRHPFLAIFDGADPSTSTGQRMVSTTPLQALYLLNDPWVHEQAVRFADRILASSKTPEQRIHAAYLRMFARPATSEEIEAANGFLARATEVLRRSGEPEDQLERSAWQACVRSWMRLNEFVVVD